MEKQEHKGSFAVLADKYDRTQTMIHGPNQANVTDWFADFHSDSPELQILVVAISFIQSRMWRKGLSLTEDAHPYGRNLYLLFFSWNVTIIYGINIMLSCLETSDWL